MTLVLKDRVLESSTSTGTGSFTLTGAQTGYQSFTAIGNGNTTYYTIQGKNPDGTLTGEWEVGIGTWSTGNTLSRDTVLSNSLGTTAKIAFSAGAKDVFCDYPASKSVNQNADNKVLIPYTPGVTNVGSLNVGDATSHSDSGVIAAFTASEPLYLYTSLQNTSSANTSYASYAVNDGGHTSYGELGINNSNYSYTAAGYPNNTFSAPLATFVESYGGPLAIGTWDSQKISFIVNGSVNTADAMTISAAGVVSLGTALGVTSGGTGLSSYTTGDILYSNATNTLTKLSVGSTGQVLTVAGGVPTWAAGGGMVYPAAGIPNSTGSAWGTSYGVTGTGSVVLSDSPTFTTAITSTGALQLTGSDTVNQNIATNQTTGTLAIGGTGATGTITIGQSTSSQLISIGAGAGTSGSVNIGSGAATTGLITIGGSGASTGTITIGRSTGAQTISIAATANSSSIVTIGGAGTSTGTITLGRSTGAQTVNIATGTTAAATTKIINIGNAGNATSTTTIAIGSATGTSTTTVNGLLVQQTYLVANLPTGSAGARSFVTNALAPTFGAAVAGGGAVGVPVYHDGTSWKVG